MNLNKDFTVSDTGDASVMAVVLRSKLQQLNKLMDLRRISRLREKSLLDADLHDYICAAREGEKRARPFLDHLTF